MVIQNDRALAVTERILARGWDKTYAVEELVFALMPLRHSPTVDRLRRVLDITDAYVGEKNRSLHRVCVLYIAYPLMLAAVPVALTDTCVGEKNRS